MRGKIGALMTTKEGIFILSGIKELWKGQPPCQTSCPNLSWSMPNYTFDITQFFIPRYDDVKILQIQPYLHPPDCYAPID